MYRVWSVCLQPAIWWENETGAKRHVTIYFMRRDKKKKRKDAFYKGVLRAICGLDKKKKKQGLTVGYLHPGKQTTWKPYILTIHGGFMSREQSVFFFLGVGVCNLQDFFNWSWWKCRLCCDMFFVRWGINERGEERQSPSQVSFFSSMSFFFQIVRGYSSCDPLERHPGGQIQGAWRGGGLLILAVQAPISQRAGERAISKAQRRLKIKDHHISCQIFVFFFFYSITSCEADH